MAVSIPNEVHLIYLLILFIYLFIYLFFPLTYFDITCIDESPLTIVKAWNSFQHYAIMIIWK